MLSPHAIAPFIIALINSFMAIRKIPGMAKGFFYFVFSLMIFAKRKTLLPLTRFRFRSVCSARRSDLWSFCLLIRWSISYFNVTIFYFNCLCNHFLTIVRKWLYVVFVPTDWRACLENMLGQVENFSQTFFCCNGFCKNVMNIRLDAKEPRDEIDFLSAVIRPNPETFLNLNCSKALYIFTQSISAGSLWFRNIKRNYSPFVIPSAGARKF